MKSNIDESYTDVVKLQDFVKKYLPSQGPLEYFVHHNTLHAFEDLKFDDALNYAGCMYGAKTKKSLKWYQKQLRSQRIYQEDLKYIFERQFPELSFDDPYVQKMLLFNNSGTKTIENAAFKKFLQNIQPQDKEIPKDFQKVTLFWDFIAKQSEKDLLQNTLQALRTKFYAAYFDKGISYWSMEDRDNGLLETFYTFVNHLPGYGLNKYLKKEVFKIQIESKIDHNKLLENLLSRLSIPNRMLKNAYLDILLKNKGWAALVISLEGNPLYNPTGINVSFLEYAIIEMILEVSCYKYLLSLKLIDNVDYSFKNNTLNKKYYAYFYEHIASVNEDYEKYLQMTELSLFNLWHEAYELNLINKTIKSLAIARKKSNSSQAPKLQVITCIDDREESIRRYFEEYSEEIETYGYAGHFGLNILFKGVRDAHFRPLCPVGVTPEFYVWEELKNTTNDKKSFLGIIKHFFFHHSKSPFFGALTAMLLAPFSLILFILDIIYPKYSYELQARLDRILSNNHDDELELIYEGDATHKGLNLSIMGDTVYNMLKTIGLTKNLAPIIYICSHGSGSMNNPHKAAYDCGACAGGRGEPNARLFSIIANRSDVRTYVKEKYNLSIPDSTVFVGGYHNTCNDDFKILDAHNFNETTIGYLREVLDHVAVMDAKERMRKFENVPLEITPKSAFKHVQNRAHNLAQPRPEYGHNTNAVCVVGERKFSKSVFFDRRAFLVSYNQEKDNDLSTLKTLVGSILPVCAGINLEYYFSFVDREYFGSGAKQPHNVTALMGVMNGYRSDLRLGLPWQMVEIHEPVRIIVVIESDLENFKQVLETSPSKKLALNYWVRIIISTPDDRFFLYEFDQYNEIDVSGEVSGIENFQNSESLFKNKRDLIDFAIIGS